MAIQSIVTRLTKPNKIIDPYIGVSVINFDAVTSISHQRSAVPSRNPIEDGSDLTDHVTLDPITLRVSAVISDNPLSIVESLLTSALTTIPDPTAFRIAISQASIARLVINKIQDRMQVAFDYFEQLYRNRIPFTFVSGLKTYRNMVITNYETPTDSNTGQIIRFNLTLQQVFIAEGRSVDLAANRDKIDGTSAASGSLGKQTANEASTSVSSKARTDSFLLGMAKKSGVLE